MDSNIKEREILEPLEIMMQALEMIAAAMKELQKRQEKLSEEGEQKIEP